MAIAAAGCAGTAPPPVASADPEQVPSTPVPVVRGATPGPEWCWAEPTALRSTDERSPYVAIQIERALFARLTGEVTDEAFPHVAALRGEGVPIWLIGPALLPSGGNVHVARSVEPALAATWDAKRPAELVKLELVGYVQDEEGHDAQRFRLKLRYLAADPIAKSRAAADIELCVIAGGDSSLDVLSRVRSQS